MRWLLFLMLSVVLIALGCNKKTTSSYARYSDARVKTDVKPYNNICRKQASYQPQERYLNHYQKKILRVNIHIIRSADGSGNFDDELGTWYAKELIKESNRRMANNVKMNLPQNNATPALPVKIELQLTGTNKKDDGIYFHERDTLCWSNKKGGVFSNYSRNQYKQLGIAKDSVYNIFMVEHHPDSIKSPTYKAGLSGIGFKDFMKVTGSFENFCDTIFRANQPPLVLDYTRSAPLLVHELGHALGLAHTWGGHDGCDDTPKHRGCWNVNEPAVPECNPVVSNNVMDYNAYQNAFTPCQIGRMHYYAINHTTTKKFIVKSYCDYDPYNKIVIAKNDSVVWNDIKYLNTNIVVKGKLTINCTLFLPNDAEVIVKPTGQLFLNNAKISNACGGTWKGINMQKDEDKAGELIATPNAIIENAKHQIDFIKGT